MSADPSLDPLSTTMVSKSTFFWRASEIRHARNSCFRFQFTTTTEINCLCYQAPVGTRLVDRGQTRVPANFRQKVPEIHGSLWTGDRQDCQRISGKRRQKSMAVLSVPGAALIPCYIMSLEVGNFSYDTGW